MAYKMEIGWLLWFRLLSELRHRGQARRESGAFLLGKPGTSRVTDFVCYDDLDKNCLNRGYIRFDGSGYVTLTEICQTKSLRVMGDVHTHPSAWTGQSESDVRHPMMARKGHLAFIVPSYAKKRFLGLSGVGAFEYLGEGNWRDSAREVRLTWI